jgi:DNA-binding NtrC family response regulator
LYNSDLALYPKLSAAQCLTHIGREGFLDEVGKIDVKYQSKILKAVESGRFYRLRGKEEVSVNVRIISATSDDLEDKIEKGEFLSELYYRLNIYRIHIPPLRERLEDIPEFANYFAKYYSNRMGKKINGLTELAMQYLAMYSWPGNVRELMTVMRRAVINCDTGLITMSDLGLPQGQGEELLKYRIAKERVLEDFQRRYMMKMLDLTQGNISEIVRLSGMNRLTCYRIINRFGLDRMKSN